MVEILLKVADDGAYFAHLTIDHHLAFIAHVSPGMVISCSFSS